MLNKFWESIGSNVAERWLEYIFGPAILFWVGGLVLYTWHVGWQTVLQDVQMFTSIQQGSWLILTFFILIFSSVLMQAIRFPILRLLEGYWVWPLNYLGIALVAIQKKTYKKKYAELNDLMKELAAKGKLDSRQLEKLTKLDVWAHTQPVSTEELLPLPLGNILRARERTPERKYGLDPIICWPRMWSLLPENVRTDLASARSSLDRLAELCFWGLLFALWIFLTPWAIVIGLLWVFITYRMACQAAMSYGDLLEAAFDLHRFSLYDAMNWPRPKNSEEEQVLGVQLTEYLWRGTLPDSKMYQSK